MSFVLGGMRLRGGLVQQAHVRGVKPRQRFTRVSLMAGTLLLLMTHILVAHVLAITDNARDLTTTVGGMLHGIDKSASVIGADQRAAKTTMSARANRKCRINDMDLPTALIKREYLDELHPVLGLSRTVKSQQEVRTRGVVAQGINPTVQSHRHWDAQRPMD